MKFLNIVHGKGTVELPEKGRNSKGRIQSGFVNESQETQAASNFFGSTVVKKLQSSKGAPANGVHQKSDARSPDTPTLSIHHVGSKPGFHFSRSPASDDSRGLRPYDKGEVFPYRPSRRTFSAGGQCDMMNEGERTEASHRRAKVVGGARSGMLKKFFKNFSNVSTPLLKASESISNIAPRASEASERFRIFEDEGTSSFVGGIYPVYNRAFPSKVSAQVVECQIRKPSCEEGSIFFHPLCGSPASPTFWSEFRYSPSNSPSVASFIPLEDGPLSRNLRYPSKSEGIDYRESSVPAPTTRITTTRPPSNTSLLSRLITKRSLVAAPKLVSNHQLKNVGHLQLPPSNADCTLQESRSRRSRFSRFFQPSSKQQQSSDLIFDGKSSLETSRRLRRPGSLDIFKIWRPESSVEGSSRKNCPSLFPHRANSSFSSPGFQTDESEAPAKVPICSIRSYSDSDSTSHSTNPWATSILYREVYAPDSDHQRVDVLFPFLPAKLLCNVPVLCAPPPPSNDDSERSKATSKLFSSPSSNKESNVDDCTEVSRSQAFKKSSSLHSNEFYDGEEAVVVVDESSKKKKSSVDDRKKRLDSSSRSSSSNSIISVNGLRQISEYRTITITPVSSPSNNKTTFGERISMPDEALGLANLAVPAGWEGSVSAPLGLKIGGGTPTQGTRHRIRARISAQFDILSGDELDDDLLQGGLADGLLISESEVQDIRRNVWRPEGIPSPCTISLGYHTAWDIGKKGCVAMKYRHGFESTINPSRLRFFIMDGTDPISFLCYYTKTTLEEGALHRKPKKGIIRAVDLLKAKWSYKQGKVTVMRSDRGGKILNIDRIPPHFMDAIIVCLREMEVCRAVNSIKCLRLKDRKDVEYRANLKKMQRRQSVTGSDSRSAFHRSSGCSNTSSAAAAAAGGRTGSICLNNKIDTPPMIIGATRKTARAMISPNSGVVASVVASSLKKHEELTGDQSSILIEEERRGAKFHISSFLSQRKGSSLLEGSSSILHPSSSTSSRRHSECDPNDTF